MRPVTFAGRFGWFHPGASTSDCAVVMCGAVGHEALCSHRAWRDLALRLAAAGLPTLRFDYHGTGDALGDDEDPGRVQAWLDSVLLAVAWLRRETGVPQVALVGLRLGATLATLAAERLEGVAALALLAPVVSGRTYARELKALMMAAPPVAGSAPNGDAGGGIEVAGFLVSAETQGELRRLDLLALQRRPAPRVLLAGRPGLSTDTKLAARLTELGADVRQEPFTGYDELMRDVNLAVPPHAVFARVVDWLAGAPHAATPPARDDTGIAPPTQRLELPEAIEETVWFGEGLFGVCCAPRSPRRDLPALLFLNTGANHHVGANRMAVRLGRRLAAQGVTSLRIDVAGIGDSPARPGRPDNLLYADESCDDVRAALGWLEGRGFRRSVVAGVCCGAYAALRSAPGEERIAGLVLVNPQRFVWHPGDSLDVQLRRTFHSSDFYRSMIRRPETWRRLVRGQVNVAGILGMAARRLGKRLGSRLAQAHGRLRGIQSERQRITGEVAKLSARGVDVLFVYAAADGGLDEFETYFGRDGAGLKRLPNAHVQILPDVDHTLATRRAQEAFLGILQDRLGLVGKAIGGNPA